MLVEDMVRFEDIRIAPEDYDLAVKIKSEDDIYVARQVVKNFAEKAGFSLADVTKITTAVSELARNIYRYAQEGAIYVRLKYQSDEVIMEVVAYDRGPGIPNIEKAISRGYSTFQRSLGLGLSGVKRLMDSFFIASEVGKGTVVIVEKRKRKF